MPILQNLRALRMKAMLSQRELGGRANVTQATIAHIENGADAQYKTARKLAEALGVQPAELLSDPPGE